MTHKKSNRIVTLAGIVSAAAISLTSSPHQDIPKDTYYERLAPTISLMRPLSSEFLVHYTGLLDNTGDTIALRNEEYKKLDSLMTKAKDVLENQLVIKTPVILYGRGYIDSIINFQLDSSINNATNRKMINNEALVNSILDTLTNYTEVVSKYFIKGSIREESQYIDTITSSAGARGLIQFMRPTWERFGDGPYLPNVFNPVKNIQAGIRYYLWMEEEFSKYHPDWNALTIAEKRDYLSTGFNGGPYLYLGNKNDNANWDRVNVPQQSINHAIKVDNAMTQIYVENLCEQILAYSKKIKRYESEKNNLLALNTQ